MDRIYRVACQAVLEVRGANKERAITDARLRFAELNGVGRWSLRADYETVEAVHAAALHKEPAGSTTSHIVASTA